MFSLSFRAASKLFSLCQNLANVDLAQLPRKVASSLNDAAEVIFSSSSPHLGSPASVDHSVVFPDLQNVDRRCSLSSIIFDNGDFLTLRLVLLVNLWPVNHLVSFEDCYSFFDQLEFQIATSEQYRGNQACNIFVSFDYTFRVFDYPYSYS